MTANLPQQTALADSIKAFGQLSYIKPEDKIILIDLAQSIGRIERELAGLRAKVVEECIHSLAEIAADWAVAGDMDKVYATDYLITTLRALKDK